MSLATNAKPDLARPHANVHGGVWRRRLARWFAVFVLFLAFFGPILANDVPLVASVGGH